MVEVQGHNTRLSMKKVRHNKVYTAKGPRDRRVRLSAHTAIQFYDVQDRLGYERASEAVDWLIHKAKSSIDKLPNTSLQQFEHLSQLASHNNNQIGEANNQSGQYKLQNIQSLADNSVNICSYNHMDSSILFPYIHLENCTQESSYRTNHKIEDPRVSPSASSSSLQPSDQQMIEKDPDQMIMVSSKLNPSGGNLLISNSEPSLVHPPAPSQNNGSFSVLTEPSLVQAPAPGQNNGSFSVLTESSMVHPSAPGQNNGSFSVLTTSKSENSTFVQCQSAAHQPSVNLSSQLSSDELAKVYISTQFFGHQEHIMAFNQPSFLMPASNLG